MLIVVFDTTYIAFSQITFTFPPSHDNSGFALVSSSPSTTVELSVDGGGPAVVPASCTDGNPPVCTISASSTAFAQTVTLTMSLTANPTSRAAEAFDFALDTHALAGGVSVLYPPVFALTAAVDTFLAANTPTTVMLTTTHAHATSSLFVKMVALGTPCTGDPVVQGQAWYLNETSYAVELTPTSGFDSVGNALCYSGSSTGVYDSVPGALFLITPTDWGVQETAEAPQLYSDTQASFAFVSKGLTLEASPAIKLLPPGGDCSLVRGVSDGFGNAGPLSIAAGTCGAEASCSLVPTESKGEFDYEICWAPNLNSRFARVLVTGVAPILVAVRSNVCNSTSDTSLNECPTGDDSALLYVLGRRFSNDMRVSVGGVSCALASLMSASERIELAGTTPGVEWGLQCKLPAGTGDNALVEIFASDIESEATATLSYVAPTLISITGCGGQNPAGDGVINCNREGGDTITLHGTNFGAASASALVGGDDCTNAKHDADSPHTTFECVLPPGITENQPVLLFQATRQRTNKLKVSYLQCPAGERDDPAEDSTKCVRCPAGKFRSEGSQQLCEQCGGEQFGTSDGAEACLQCPVFATANRTFTGCLCPKDYYAVEKDKIDFYGFALGGQNVSYSAADFMCFECPNGAMCQEPGTHITTVKAQPGYFASVDGKNNEFMRCPGSGCVRTGDIECAEGFTGPTCSVCAIGWGRKGDFDCEK